MRISKLFPILYISFEMSPKIQGFPKMEETHSNLKHDFYDTSAVNKNDKLTFTNMLVSEKDKTQS